MAAATADFSGAIILQEQLPTHPVHGANQAIQRALEVAGRLVQETSDRVSGRLQAIGLSTMGLTLEDRVLMAPNVPGWGELSIPQIMRAAFPSIKVTIENDVKAAALAEVKWGALAGSQSGIYLNLGTGIAATLVMDGRILRGAHDAAGEIAHNLRHVHEEVGAAQGRTPLEEFVGGGAVEKRAKARWGSSCSVQEVFARMATDSDARTFVEETLSELAFHVTNLAIAFDPQRLVVGGGMMAAQDEIVPRLTESLRRFAPFPPEVLVGRFSGDAGLRGAIAMAIEPAGGK